MIRNGGILEAGREENTMRVLLAEKIRDLRKERHLTQERLAEAMGVTVGAVSKWESGSSTPDIALIMELAEFFEVSVDVLLGFSQQSLTLKETVQHLRDLRVQKEYDTALREGEKAFQKYPNNFAVVYEYAQLCQLVVLETGDSAILQRCQALCQRSLELISQNRDPEISEVSIRNMIAEIYRSQGNSKKALELFKENNINGINNGLIGNMLAQENPEEALVYLTKALLVTLKELFQFCVGYNNVCAQLGKAEEALSFTRLLLQFQEGLQQPGKLSYLNRISVMLLTLSAFSSLQLGNEEDAKRYLRQARREALRFDACPDYTLTNIKFVTFQRDAAAYDDFGSTSVEGIEKILKENRQEYPTIWTIWEELCHEKP